MRRGWMREKTRGWLRGKPGGKQRGRLRHWRAGRHCQRRPCHRVGSAGGDVKFLHRGKGRRATGVAGTGGRLACTILLLQRELLKARHTSDGAVALKIQPGAAASRAGGVRKCGGGHRRCPAGGGVCFCFKYTVEVIEVCVYYMYIYLHILLHILAKLYMGTLNLFR